MRNIFYHYNAQGMLVLHYSDDYGYRFEERYLYYSLPQAVKRFRHQHGLWRKHITIQKLY